MAPTRAPRRALTIAGSDSGGGAGIQADLKTFAAHGVYGLSAVTAVTAQNTREVRAIAAVPPAVVAAQIDAVLDDFGADAVKIGMLWSAATVRVVASTLRRRCRPPDEGAHGDRRTPIVLDPVLAAESGAALLVPDAPATEAGGGAVGGGAVGAGAVAGGAVGGGAVGGGAAGAGEAIVALVRDLLPLATVVTPNLPELARLVQALGPATAGASASRAEPSPAGPAAAPEGEAARLAMARRLAALGPAVLAKGGHDCGTAAGEVVDLLLIPAAGPGGVERVVRFAGPRLATRATHGTGCTLSAAIAARLAAGEELAEAVRGAIEYVRLAMAAAPPLGGGPGPLDHFHAFHADRAR